MSMRQWSSLTVVQPHKKMHWFKSIKHILKGRSKFWFRPWPRDSIYLIIYLQNLARLDWVSKLTCAMNRVELEPGWLQIKSTVGFWRTGIFHNVVSGTCPQSTHIWPNLPDIWNTLPDDHHIVDQICQIFEVVLYLHDDDRSSHSWPNLIGSHGAGADSFLNSGCLFLLFWLIILIILVDYSDYSGWLFWILVVFSDYSDSFLNFGWLFWIFWLIILIHSWILVDYSDYSGWLFWLYWLIILNSGWLFWFIPEFWLIILIILNSGWLSSGRWILSQGFIEADRLTGHFSSSYTLNQPWPSKL